jgi:uncharacterized LabA/DUF88 family protein
MLFGGVVARTFIYVDGFNFYYGVVKNTPYKWLNLKKIFASILPAKNHAEAIKYYTAHVNAASDPGAPRRQQLYLDALATIPEITIHKGTFMTHEKWLPLARATTATLKEIPNVIRAKGDMVLANVIRAEEKGSDVKLGVHLVHDGWRDLYDVGVVVSNDTDLEEPLRIVTRELRKAVVLICPSGPARRSSSHKTLIKVASFTYAAKDTFTEERLMAAQFSNPVIAADGTVISKPESW